MFVIW